MDLTERFAELVCAPSFPLDEAALLIAAHAGHETDVAVSLSALDTLAEMVPEPDVELLAMVLFGAMGFTGDQSDYYDPANSYLDLVIERRRGIPITLSILMLEVGRRAGVELAGVGTPAHFMVRTLGEPPRFVDAFGGGRLLDRPQLESFFARITPGVDLAPYLAPVDNLHIVRRMLGNLVAIHQRAGDRDALLWTARLRTVLPGSTPEDRRAYGGALAACGDFTRAAKVIESLVEDGHVDDPDEQLAAAQRLRARLN